MTVTNNTDSVNGDTSSPENLINNPGPDGISLPEAIMAANESPGPHTILFDPSLKGSTIKCTIGIPILYRDQITINGDINNDGAPDITINGAEVISDTCFWIQASDISINGFIIIGFKWAGIQITAESSDGKSRINGAKLYDNTIKDGDTGGIVVQTLGIDCLIRNVDIVNNKIVNNKFVGIGIDGGGWPGGTNNRIENITIRENTIKKNGKHAIFATAATYQESKNNTLSGLEISDNTITGHKILSLLFSAGNDLRSKNNKLADVLISNNYIEGTPCNIEIVGGAEEDASGNSVSNVAIVQNIFQGGGIQIGVGSFGAKNNIVDNILIGWNKIFNSKAHGITICGGGGSNNTKGNTAKKITIINNLIVNNDAIGIQLMGGYYGGPDNLVDNVNILNNTIVRNGYANPTWAGGITIVNNVISSGNIVKRIKIANTILWENMQNDRIDGQSPDSVECSILLDSRFTGKNGNFYASPLFISPSNLDYCIRQTSPAIDSGSPYETGVGDIDLLGYPRILDGNGDGEAVVDIGAYEFVEGKKLKVEYFKINGGASRTFDRMVTLDNKCNTTASEYMTAEDKKFVKNVKSESYFSSPSYQLSPGYGKKKVYFKVKNESGWSKIKKSTILLEKPEEGQPSIVYFAIDTGNDITIKRNITLHSECTGDPTHYRASESLSDFNKKEWKPYTQALKFKLSEGLGRKTIYVQVKNGIWESGIVCDQISAFYPWR
jgi:hypothetical protein